MLQHLAQLTVNGIITGTILALTGVGVTLVFGIQRIANFAYGEYLTFGAYVALLVNTGLGLNLFIAAIAAVLATAALAVVLHFVVLKPLAGRGLVATSLITVGLALMVRDVVFLVAGPRIRKLAIDQTAVFDLGLVRISPGQAVAVAITLIAGAGGRLFSGANHRRVRRCGRSLTIAISRRSPASTSNEWEPSSGASPARSPESAGSCCAVTRHSRS